MTWDKHEFAAPRKSGSSRQSPASQQSRKALRAEKQREAAERQARLDGMPEVERKILVCRDRAERETRHRYRMTLTAGLGLAASVALLQR